MATNLAALCIATNYNLSLRADGRLIAWGTGTITNTPKNVTNIISMAAGLLHGLAITNAGAPAIIGPTAFAAQSPVANPLPLAVRAVGAGALTYQWLTNGVPVAGATNAVPVIYGQAGGNAIVYQVIVSNACGSTTSAPVSVAIQNLNMWGSDLDRQCEPPPNLGAPLILAPGAFHNLALTTNGTVIAWGKNTSNQTNVPASVTNVIALAAGGSHSLALRGDGSVIAWGNNGSGQTNVPPNATNVIAIAAGSAHSVALLQNGTVLAWGDTNYAQTPAPVYLTNVTAIAAGYFHTLALLENHTVFCWGSQNLVPASATNVVAIAAGYEHSLALRADGSVIAWGDNAYGQCSVPAAVTNAVAIAAGFGQSLALLNNGAVIGWGRTNSVLMPQGLNNVAMIGCGEDHAFAYVNAGPPQIFTNPAPVTVHAGASTLLSGYVAGAYPLTYQWSQNGQPLPGATNRWLPLANLTVTNAGAYTLTAANAQGTATSDPINLTVLTAPYFTPALPVPQNFAVGTAQCLPVTAAGAAPLNYQVLLNGNLVTDGVLFGGQIPPSVCFDPIAYADSGSLNLIVTNAYGSFSGLIANLAATPVAGWGDGTAGQLTVPAAASNVVAVACGGDHCLALRTDGGVVAWGDNTYGQNTVPLTATGIVAITEGDTSSLALRSDGTIVAWGDNTYGQTNVPASASGAVQIAAGATTSGALMPNGTMIAWDNLSPSDKNGYKATGATNILSLAARGGNYLALCANGAVISWNYATPTPPPLTNAVAVAAGAFHGLALLANGSVVGWGQNTYGQITVPAAATNIVAIAAGDYDSVALRADGSLITWGYTDYNQIPAPFSASGFTTIAAGSLHKLAVTEQTISNSVALGGSAWLTSGNLGGGLSAFQWLFDGQPITGATNATLLLTNLQWATSGYYQVVVSNPVQVVSGPLINVSVPPFQFNLSALTWQPANGSVTLQLTGASPTNSVEIFASTNLLQWQPIFTNPPTSNPITFTDTPPPNVLQRFYRAMQIP
jgi:alpha-tubulin suppressor-like RCC1 family protein